LGVPTCSCLDGFLGPRCQFVASSANSSSTRPGPEFVDLEFYQQALLGSSIVGLIFLFVLLAVCIAFIRVRQKHQNKPEVVKKGKRSRVFSTSSNSGKRSSSKSRIETGSYNQGFDDMCIDSKGHMCQALIGDDGVVLDLEDCCNMTVCEKPCVEASFRKPTSRKLGYDPQRLLRQDNELF